MYVQVTAIMLGNTRKVPELDRDAWYSIGLPCMTRRVLRNRYIFRDLPLDSLQNHVQTYPSIEILLIYTTGAGTAGSWYYRSGLESHVPLDYTLACLHLCKSVQRRCSECKRSFDAYDLDEYVCVLCWGSRCGACGDLVHEHGRNNQCLFGPGTLQPRDVRVGRDYSNIDDIVLKMHKPLV